MFTVFFFSFSSFVTPLFFFFFYFWDKCNWFFCVHEIVTSAIGLSGPNDHSCNLMNNGRGPALSRPLLFIVFLFFSYSCPLLTTLGFIYLAFYKQCTVNLYICLMCWHVFAMTSLQLAYNNTFPVTISNYVPLWYAFIHVYISLWCMYIYLHLYI